MEIKDFEEKILNELKSVVDNIIENNVELNISARARAGAEISSWIEDKFVESSKEHQYFKNCLSASVKLKELLKFVYDYTRAISKGFSGVSSSVQD